MMIDILVNYLYQVVFTIGSIGLFGMIIAFCNRIFYRNFGSKSSLVCHVTGVIGTPVHECAHALFCLIFGHKIIEMKLFQIHSEDGTLGYVSHTYNKKNIYQRIGNFFIGVAPIIVISVILYLLSLFLIPNMINLIQKEVLIFSWNKSIINIFKILGAYVQTGGFWAFIAISLFLALHMNLSKADIKGAFSGLVFLLITIFLIDVIIGLISAKALTKFSNIMMFIATTLNTFLILSTCISFIAVLLSFLYKYTIGKRIK